MADFSILFKYFSANKKLSFLNQHSPPEVLQEHQS